MHTAIRSRLSSFLKTLSSNGLESSPTLGTTVSVGQGRVLAEEGKQGQEFLMIESGEATVTRNGQQIARLGPGDFFGEISLLAPVPQIATVTAASPMVVRAYNRREFNTLISDDHSLHTKISKQAVHQLAGAAL